MMLGYKHRWVALKGADKCMHGFVPFGLLIDAGATQASPLTAVSDLIPQPNVLLSLAAVVQTKSPGQSQKAIRHLKMVDIAYLWTCMPA